jgi:PAS domain-containing protein
MEPQESEKLYRMLFDRSMNGIIMTDPGDGGKISSSYLTACLMSEWMEEKLIGKGHDAMFDLESKADMVTSFRNSEAQYIAGRDKI